MSASVRSSPIFSTCLHPGMASSLRSELCSHARLLSSLGLRQGAKWALELVTGMAPDSEGFSLLRVAPSACYMSLALGCGGSEADEVAFMLAKVYFDNKEFARAAHALDAQHAPAGSAAVPSSYPPRSYFLRCYALYLVSREARGAAGRAEAGTGEQMRARLHAFARSYPASKGA